MRRGTRQTVARAVALVVVALLVGCGRVTPDGAGPDASGTSPGPQGDESVSNAVGLVNLWRVDGVAGEGNETWLRLDAGELTLWRECGILDGSWDATAGMFVASLHGGSGTCGGTAGAFDVPWLEEVAAYRAAGEGWELLDVDGAVVAELTVDGAPDPIDTRAAEYAQPPEVTDEVRALFARREPLPEAVTPASAEDLIGRWVPADGAPNDPHVEFLADTTWSGSDGCNGAGGRWRANTEGALVTTSGPMTLIGCAGAPVPSWVSSAATAGLQDGALVLYDRAGAELGTLVRG